MSAANGSVIGMTKIFDSGAPSVRWNLVLVAEGYRASDLATFVTDAEAVRDQLLAEPPFDTPELACAINIYRLDVESDEAGADKPNCDDGGGDGSTKDTYFDATFCNSGTTQRALNGDSALVQSTVEAILPQWHQILVIVNDPERGGTGGSVGWTSNSSADWRDVSIHEIGHSAFGLADEYDYDSGDDFTGTEPDQPNVSTESDPALVKWSSLVTAGADDPTMANADCATVNNDASPVPAGVVGTFEGAKYWHCGIYRPVYSCMMRVTNAPFCPVCAKVILDVMEEFAVPAPGGDVTLEETTVNFNDVPVELTVVRAAHFLVDSCFPVTFQIITPPTAPFSLDSPATMVATPSGATPWSAYYRFKLECDSAGSIPSQNVVVRCLETLEDFSITLTGNCIPRPNVATQLVFDQSGSMLNLTDEGRTKEDVLKDSASVFIDLLYDDNGIGINSYDHDAYNILNIDDAGAAGSGGNRDESITKITNFAANPAGYTAIGDGIELAREKLNAVSYDKKAMVVLTDGIETADKRIEDVADGVINQKVYAIGLGTAEQIQPVALNALTSGTNGYLLMTGNLSSDDTFLLSKYYLQILAGLNNNEIIFDPEGIVSPGVVERIPFEVVASDIEITGIVLARPAHVLQMALEAPNGAIISVSNSSVESTRTSRSLFIRSGLPLSDNGNLIHEGRWHLLITLDPKYNDRLSKIIHSKKGNYNDNAYQNLNGIQYSASVHTYTNLRMFTDVHQSSMEPGAKLTINARLTEYGVSFRGYANVRAELIRPDSSKIEFALHAAAGEAELFTANLNATMAGIYRFRIIAKGRSSDELSFTREQLRTAAIWHGGDTPRTPQSDSDKTDWCEWLKCLIEKGVISKQLIKKLDAAGLDITGLAKCMCNLRGKKPPVISHTEDMKQIISSINTFLDNARKT